MTPELDIDLELDVLAVDAAPAALREAVIFAFDRANRHVDLDGHMHVETTNISKANVCGYYGAEIPGGDEMGLQPDKIYMLYRDPAELEAGAKTFENKPLMFKHVAVLASAPQKYYIAGSISNVRYSHPYLKASLAVWDGDAIREIESHEREQLSCGYRYRADMSPGTTVDGVKFDGIMRDIVGNHVALVEVGRAGSDVLVSDELPQGFEHMKKSILIAALAPFMAADADMIAVDAAIAKVALDAKRAKDEPAQEPACNDPKPNAAKAQDESAVAETVKGKDAKACATDEDDMEMSEDEGPEMSPGPTAKPKVQDGGKSGAMDKSAMDAAIATAVAANDALHLARREVETVLGAVALDSAPAVYKAACDKLGVDTAGVDASALRAVFKLATKKDAPAIATDSASHKSTVEAFGLGRFQ